MKNIFTLFAIILATASFGQAEESVDKLRTQSGIDPTRVPTGAGYYVMHYNKEGDIAQIDNRFVGNIGIHNWSFQLKFDFVTTNNLADGMFRTGYGDTKLNIQNAFYVKGKNAFAGAVEFTFPTASNSIANGAGIGSHFIAMPSFTWSHTVTPSVLFVLQPQYAFSMAKDLYVPDLSLLTMRIFVAKFYKTGYFFVVEPRPMYDFQRDRFDLILSPIMGKALGKGYNAIVLTEIPTKSSTIKNRGILIKAGLNANF